MLLKLERKAPARSKERLVFNLPRRRFHGSFQCDGHLHPSIFSVIVLPLVNLRVFRQHASKPARLSPPLGRRSDPPADWEGIAETAAAARGMPGDSGRFGFPLEALDSELQDASSWGLSPRYARAHEPQLF